MVPMLAISAVSDARRPVVLVGELARQVQLGVERAGRLRDVRALRREHVRRRLARDLRDVVRHERDARRRARARATPRTGPVRRRTRSSAAAVTASSASSAGYIQRDGTCCDWKTGRWCSSGHGACGSNEPKPSDSSTSARPLERRLARPARDERRRARTAATTAHPTYIPHSCQPHSLTPACAAVACPDRATSGRRRSASRSIVSFESTRRGCFHHLEHRQELRRREPQRHDAARRADDDRPDRPRRERQEDGVERDGEDRLAAAGRCPPCRP